MLEEAKSLFKYAEDNFGTNNSTGFPCYYELARKTQEQVPKEPTKQIKNGIATG